MAINAKFTRTLPAPTATISSGFVFLLSTGWFTDADQGAAGSPIGGGANSIANGGGDMQIFSDTAATTRLPIEVVSFVTGGSPEAQIWVRTPSYTSGDTITIGRDDTQTTQPAVTDTYGRNAVWAERVGVIHFEDAVTGSGDVVSSSGTPSDDTTGTVTSATANIGKGFDTDGTSNSFISVYNPCEIDPTSNFTISQWIKYNTTPSGEDKSVWSFNVNNDSERLELGVDISANNHWKIFSVGETPNNAGIAPVAGTWHKTDTVYNGSTLTLYVDGSLAYSVTPTGSGWQSTPTNFILHARYNAATSGFSRRSDAITSEFETLQSIKTADYIASEYANQNDPDNFGTSSGWVLVLNLITVVSNSYRQRRL